MTTQQLDRRTRILTLAKIDTFLKEAEKEDLDLLLKLLQHLDHEPHRFPLGSTSYRQSYTASRFKKNHDRIAKR